MEKTLLTRKELAQRWGVSTKVIKNYEDDGIISRVQKFPTPKYNVLSIMKIEGLEELNPLSPMERRRLEREIDALKAKVNSQNELLRKYSLLGAETINFLSC